MAEIDVTNDLAQINQQLEDLVSQLNQINTQRDKVIEQIHNLNGIAMYLRGKQEEPIEDLTRTEEYPEVMIQEE